ncbi:leader peptidase (prepilin peptidase)/N-methyltransferase [Aeromicrobium panaciterrae]|uniref:Leader peptidase (Prepilin peptidase)/N-methyltransferase n=1 Tax=Aeromicrobium panaciterrae TaxID=363861 RepID=A0ABU1UNI6_9ACTN|nr:prepilin peptidase [Aeromicrobium panaciterrae]MDR7086744.1 leader peptidase (prepilin peptidase)/N-methyltransferase [Aeromicrobium panaciterrae]
MTIALAAFAAAMLGAAGPWVLRRIPEPEEPAEDKVPYAQLADARGLSVGLAIAAALMAGLVAWRIDRPELVPVWVLIAGVGSWLTYIDWRTKLLPFVIVAPAYLATLLLVGLGALLLKESEVFTRALVANIVVYVIFRVLYWIGGRFFGGAFGYGDVRLSGVLALALGALGGSAVFVGMYSGFILGAVFGVILSRLKIVDARGYAFGPYMVAGAVIGAAWGSLIYPV